MNGLSAVIALVAHDFFDHRHRPIGDGGDRLELVGGFGQRRLDRRGVAFVGTLHGDADDRAGFEIDCVFGFISRLVPAILHLRDLGVRIVRMHPVVIGAFAQFPIDPRQVSAREVPIPEDFARYVRNPS